MDALELVWFVEALIANSCLPKEKPENKPVHAAKEYTKDYTKLTIHSVAVQSNKVVVQGSTDLPDGVKVWVDIENCSLSFKEIVNVLVSVHLKETGQSHGNP
jgi:hypothetical protein